MTITKSQRAALCRAYHRAVIAYSYSPERRGCHFMSYRAFRCTVQVGPGTSIVVRCAGVWLRIEPDGHTQRLV